MSKTRSLIIAAGMLLLLTTCQMDLVESLPVPPELPYGAIVSSSVDTGIGFNAYSFALEWKRSPGELYADAVYDDEDASVTTALTLAYEKWQDYTRLINPRPFYDTGSGMAPAGASTAFDVFVTGSPPSPPQLDNASTSGKIVIHRYWPKITDGSGQSVTPTRTAWLDSAVVAIRAEAFKEAVAGIEAMMAGIEASPFYNTGLPAHASLMDLHQAMADTIAYNPDACTQRGAFDVDFPSGGGKGNAKIDQANTGFLYEYYLGHVPPPAEYTTSSGPFALPE